jgi:hypothetical protein
MDNISTGVGNPLSPYTEELLSVEDEKRLDDKGDLITSGLLWSQSHTDTYMWIALWRGTELTQLVPGGKGQSDISLEMLWSGWSLSIGISPGRPRFNLGTIGAALEVPSDLGEDPIKSQYIAEWIGDTIAECLGTAGLRTSSDKLKDLGLLVSTAADRAIGTVL